MIVSLRASPAPSASPRWPRLLKRSQAAEYLGISIDTFDRICPVPPIDLDMRGLRFDREKLDAWIDALPDGDGKTVVADEADQTRIELDADTRRHKSLERLKCQQTTR